MVEYIDFKLEDLYKPVSDQEILSEYEIQTKQFVSEESREISHIFLEINDLQNDEQVLSKLSLINERLVKGELFSDMALEFSQDPSTAETGGYLGFIQKEVVFLTHLKLLSFLQWKLVISRRQLRLKQDIILLN